MFFYFIKEKIMNTSFLNCICWPDIIITLIITIITYIIIYISKPGLSIDKVEKSDEGLKISVSNKGRFTAVNLRIEICGYFRETKQSFHFKIDHEDFLMLTRRNSCDNEKIYNVVGLSERALKFKTYKGLLEEINSGKCLLRVRIHSYHSISGLGKAEEACFTFENNIFTKLLPGCKK